MILTTEIVKSVLNLKLWNLCDNNVKEMIQFYTVYSELKDTR